MPESGLPNAVYVGNMRSGSTFVRSFLEAHPDIRWTRRAWCFQLGDTDAERCAAYRRALDSPSTSACHVDMYESLFLGQYFRSSPPGDFSKRESPEWETAWAVAPNHDLAAGPMAIEPGEVARRVRACVPSARVLIVLREQVAWMRSMYRHYLRSLPRRQRDFSDFLTTLDGQAAWLALRYDDAVEPYLDGFGSDSVLVMLFEELAGEPSAALDRLCDFLGVARVEFHPELGERNEGLTPAEARRLRYGRAREAWREWRDARSGPRPGALDILTDDEVARVRAASVEGNRRLARLLGVDVAALGYPV